MTPFWIIGMPLLLIAAYIVAMNWGCVIVSIINKRKGIDRHHSTVPIVSLIFAYGAYSCYPHSGGVWILIVPLADIGNWRLFWLPVFLIQGARSRKSSKNDPS